MEKWQLEYNAINYGNSPYFTEMAKQNQTDW